ncbi:endolytic transglycosylase MltG [Corynebacterium lujinxingii]|uniref:Endolytic murein transglycosylase n=1 Tax=Corynebacterium lujinxingii TaxID=2763010 RepID=A0A7H0JWE1_9CORY|nr:endolytic transglycosylase MltG [Corynebacterium lujinxingii]MBC3178852.1 endolytic transglycosylase MltG [Corynebacterium lujinxingii]NNO11134.1 ABC transporter substrate-binding protein [Corynebacterium lujinxingii]QNP89357.1 endolytic transglycosylase MltG [Corynebacterium lujinxingii]
MSTREAARRRTRGTAVLVASILLIIGLVAWIAVARNLSGSKDFAGTGNGEEQVVQIPEGSSLSVLGPELEERGIVGSDGAFQTAAANNPDSDNIQPGFYRLEGEMSANSAVEALLDPEKRITPLQVYGGATLMDINVLGGQTRHGIFSMIQAVTCGDQPGGDCVNVEKLHNAAANADPAELGVPEWARETVAARAGDAKRLEGLIAPGEYIIDPQASAEDILQDLVTRSAKQYDSTDIVNRAQAIGLSPYELLTAASLVEREAPAGEFDKVARVILNRLDEPMRLEFDSTVNYGLPSVEVATTDEDRKRVTPWNTYAMDGLPQTPISSPSIEAIDAMEHPAEGNWLFFVTVDKDGTTVFNDTFEQHLNDTQRAVDSGILDSQR